MSNDLFITRDQPREGPAASHRAAIFGCLLVVLLMSGCGNVSYGPSETMSSTRNTGLLGGGG